MLKMIRSAARAVARVYRHKEAFLVAFIVALAGSFGVLWSMGLAPEATPAVAAVEASATTTPPAAPSGPEAPVRIEIPAAGISAVVANPATTTTSVLDAALLSGAVRYPTSALLGASGNVVIFGHSSYLPIVHNQAYKTFDGIQSLQPGDTIAVSSADAVYTYAVDSVTKESAASDAGIPLSVSGRMLTLATCDSFGKKTDRFIVTAHFVESHSVASS